MVWTLVADKIRGHRFQRLEIQITRVNSHFIPNDAQLELEGDLVATALHVVAKRDLLMEGGSRKWGATFWLVRSFQVDGLSEATQPHLYLTSSKSWHLKYFQWQLS